MCCGHSSDTATTFASSQIVSPWYGLPDRSGPAAVLLQQRSPSRPLAAKERSERLPPAIRSASVQRVIHACGFLLAEVRAPLLTNASTAREPRNGQDAVMRPAV